MLSAVADDQLSVLSHNGCALTGRRQLLRLSTREMSSARAIEGWSVPLSVITRLRYLPSPRRHMRDAPLPVTWSASLV